MNPLRFAGAVFSVVLRAVVAILGGEVARLRLRLEAAQAETLLARSELALALLDANQARADADAAESSTELELPAGARWHGALLREGGPEADIVVALAPSGIVTLVQGERTDAELHQLLSVALARLREPRE